VIGDADTLNLRPQVAQWYPGYAKGALSNVQVSVKASGLSYAYDDFNTVDDWVMVYGQLLVSGGGTSDVYGPLIGYAAGRHKTQMLTDNHRAKVTIQDGVMLFGESRVFICADDRMNSYYGMAFSNDLLGQKVAIIRGKSSISVDYYEWTTTTLGSGDEFEVWFDRRNSTVRIYKNDVEIASQFFPPTDIPHGPGARWTGVVMSARWLLDQGPRFDSFEASDVEEPDPVVFDPIDSLTVNPNWVNVLGSLEVHPHLLAEPSLGPNAVLFASTAARWTTQMGTNSVRAVFTAYRISAGKMRVVLRSNSAMTNWIGVQFDGLLNKVQIVTGSGPATVTTRASAYDWVSTWQTWSVTWNEATETIKVYRGGRRDPVLSWAAGANFNGTGRYVGLSWTADLLTLGVEPLNIAAYDASKFDPVDGEEGGS
jgi:hypothetical protein